MRRRAREARRPAIRRAYACQTRIRGGWSGGLKPRPSISRSSLAENAACSASRLMRAASEGAGSGTLAIPVLGRGWCLVWTTGHVAGHHIHVGGGIRGGLGHRLRRQRREQQPRRNAKHDPEVGKPSQGHSSVSHAGTLRANGCPITISQGADRWECCRGATTGQKPPPVLPDQSSVVRKNNLLSETQKL